MESCENEQSLPTAEGSAGTPVSRKRGKIGRRACDACKIRKIRCTEIAPCKRCTKVGIACTFNKQQALRGPRNLREKTLRKIEGVQAQVVQDVAPDTPSALPGVSPTAPVDDSATPYQTPVPSLVLRLCTYRLRLFPVWPIVAVEEVMASLYRDHNTDLGSYALANAVGAATMAQLKLSPSDSNDINDSATAASMETECQRAKALLHASPSGPEMNLNMLRISFFLHIYYENQVPGGAKSLLCLREAISIAQIMNLHKESSYTLLPSHEQQIRRRILWLLFVTERGVAMLHKLPVVLRANVRFPTLDGGDRQDEAHILPAFKQLVNLFWIIDQSGVFGLMLDADDTSGVVHTPLFNRSIDSLQRQLQEAPSDSEQSNDVQKADVYITRLWMQAMLWKMVIGADVLHPMQIARDLLCFVAGLPSSAIEAHGPTIEFKIFEIASAVTDALGRKWVTQSGALQVIDGGSRSILNGLQRLLGSCRGGNDTLLGRLRGRIAALKGQAQIPILPAPLMELEETVQGWDGNLDDDNVGRTGYVTGYEAEPRNMAILAPNMSPFGLTPLMLAALSQNMSPSPALEEENPTGRVNAMNGTFRGVFYEQNLGHGYQ